MTKFSAARAVTGLAASVLPPSLFRKCRLGIDVLRLAAGPRPTTPGLRHASLRPQLFRMTTASPASLTVKKSTAHPAATSKTSLTAAGTNPARSAIAELRAHEQVKAKARDAGCAGQRGRSHRADPAGPGDPAG